VFSYIFTEGRRFIYYALIVLTQFWLQPVPYADLSGDGYVDLNDYAILCRIEQGDIWVAKYNWLCENTYVDGSTELVEGWTYTVWETEPLKRDRHPEIPGFDWTDQLGQQPLAEMNYIFFEEMFPDLIIEDANEPLYMELPARQSPPPSITRWEIASTHGNGIGQLWQVMADGYVEPRAGGIERLRVWFNQPMNTDDSDCDIILITNERDGSELHPCSVQWQQPDCMVITLCSALPDRDTFRIRIDEALWSAQNLLLGGTGEICVSTLKGDVDADRSVTAEDIRAVQNHIGEAVDELNAGFDVDGSGAIDLKDAFIVLGAVGNSAPACQP